MKSGEKTVSRIERAYYKLNKEVARSTKSDLTSIELSDTDNCKLAERLQKKTRILNKHVKNGMKTMVSKGQLLEMGIEDSSNQTSHVPTPVFSPQSTDQPLISTIYEHEFEILFYLSVDFSLFENTKYEVFFDNSVWDEYEDLVYAISHDKVQETQKIIKRQDISLSESVRPNGDYVLHVAAEYGRFKTFQYLISLGADFLALNYVNIQSKITKT